MRHLIPLLAGTLAKEPGTLDEVAHLAAESFRTHLVDAVPQLAFSGPGP